MVFETMLRSDLKRPVKVNQLTGNMFSADNGGNKITVEILDNGETATISGSVHGYVIRPDNKTVVITGTLTGNKASIVLPASAYVIVGQISIVIKVGNTTVGACTAYVYRTTTDTIVDPGSVVPSISELLAKIADCEAATVAANTAATNYESVVANQDAKIDDLKSAMGDMNVSSVAMNNYKGYIDYSTNKWKNIGSSTYAYVVIPVNGGESLTLKSNGSIASVFASLTAYSEPTTGGTPSFSSADGWTETKKVGTSSTAQTFTGTLPSDAKFLYVQIKSYLPANIIINGYDYKNTLTKNLQDLIEVSNTTATDLAALNGKVIKCDKAINSASLLVSPYDDLNTLPQGSIVTYIGQIPSHVPANVTSTTDAAITVITYNYVNSEQLIGGAVQLVVGSSGNAWVRMKYTNSKWTTFKNITGSEGTEVLVPALSTFDHIGIIGDSWSSGSVYTAQGVYDHYPKLRWGYIASKLYGFTPAFFTSPGASTKTWLTKSAGLPAMQAADAQELYICCLGINDQANSYTIGNSTDMDDDTADSFYGSYGKIIRAIKAKAQYAKIAVALIPVYKANEDVSAYNTAIRNIADHFSIGLLDTDIDPFFNSNLFKNDRQWNHLTAVGYTGMARAINAMLAKDYDVNHSYWKYSMIDI